MEPAGGAPELFDRGFKYLFFAQQATADKQGDVWANWLTTDVPENERPKTAAYPTLDDPFAQPTSEGIEKILSGAGIKTVYRKTYTIDNPNLDAIANAVKATGAELVVQRGHLRGRRGHGALAAQGELHARVVLPDHGALAGRPVQRRPSARGRRRESSTR